MDDTLFVVTYPEISKYAETSPILSGDEAKHYDFDQIVRCPRCGQPVSGGRWIAPRKIVLTSRKVPDFLYTFGSTVPFLISENALRKIQAAGLTGINSAELIDNARFLRKAKSEISIPNYYYIEVERSRITLDQERSLIEYSECLEYIQCSLCCPVRGSRMAAKHLHWNMDAFENFDIFQTYEMRDTLIVSKRFVEFCHNQKFTNFHCCPSSEWKLGYYGLEELFSE